MREDQGGVKINLTAASEGIEGDVLARPPSPVDPSVFKYKKPKRGRPKKVRPEESASSTSQGEAPSDIIDVQVRLKLVLRRLCKKSTLEAGVIVW